MPALWRRTTRRLAAGEESAIAALARRRLAHEPVARIVGAKEFWSLRLRVDAATLVPRPETETVVEAALAAIDRRGSRTRAVAYCRSRHRHRRHLARASDRIAECLRRRHRRQSRRAGDRARQCSPPGLDARRLCRLRHGGGAVWSVRHHRLQSALYRLRRDRHVCLRRCACSIRAAPSTGDRDGLDFYRAIAAAAPALLAPDGVLVVELGAGPGGIGRRFICRGRSCAVSRRDPILTVLPRALVARKRTSQRACGVEHWNPGKKALGMSAGTD